MSTIKKASPSRLDLTVMDVTDIADGQKATFDFVVDVV